MNQKSILISGAAGFIGCHLARHYLSQNYRVIAVDNFSTGRIENLRFIESHPLASANFVFAKADVCQNWNFLELVPSSWLENLANVLHFASPASPPLYQKLALETLWVNSIGLRNALECADRFGAKCVFASTSEIYGDPEVHPQVESYRGNVNTVGPRSCYDEAKRFGEALIYTHNLKAKSSHGMVRIFNTYGPHMNPVDGRVVINFLVQALKGEKLSIYGNGKQTRSFCFVDDLVEAISLYASSSQSQPINIGNDKEFTILELAQHVQDLFKEKKLEIVHSDLPVDDPLQRKPDLSLAKTALGFAPKVLLKDGLERMAQHLKQELRL